MPGIFSTESASSFAPLSIISIDHQSPCGRLRIYCKDFCKMFWQFRNENRRNSFILVYLKKQTLKSGPMMPEGFAGHCRKKILMFRQAISEAAHQKLAGADLPGKHNPAHSALAKINQKIAEAFY